jgi:hypothetical protein
MKYQAIGVAMMNAIPINTTNSSEQGKTIFAARGAQHLPDTHFLIRYGYNDAGHKDRTTKEYRYHRKYFIKR